MFITRLFIAIMLFASTVGALRSTTRIPKLYVRLSTKVFLSSSVKNTIPNCEAPLFSREADAKYFEFDRLEKEIYDWWEESGYFKPSDDASKKSFVISMPPPNVTGYLHMGHAMFVALQDIMIRFHRMRGKAALWVPGTDHAGIATQLLVERALVAEGTSRQILGREKFLERVWNWKEEKGGYIIGQMRRLGASADWSRERFTLEPELSDSVTEAFVRLHEKGLVYKGDYLVNWSPNLQTAVSDLEVEYSEEIGKLYYFKYMIDDTNFIPVATTRPETILGDTAVCVHPEDGRYKEYIGKMVKVPMLDRMIPVISDEYVDREFGTGALKITPAHDPNDYVLGKKHGLPMIKIMNKDASINSAGGHRYEGLDRFICREKLWIDMEKAGLVIKADAHTQRVPRSQRGGEIIEPMVSGQWFVKMDNMANRAIQAVKDKDIVIIPDRFEKTWNGWLENIHDWCVSRQLWWGHRIPAYYVDGSPDGSQFVVARSEQEAYAKAIMQFGEGVTLTQDEDVLDTWFSSGLWPFATVGWPQQEASEPSSDFNRFYPSSVMETGYDILFFWVARMVMMGLEFTGKSPFHTIYMHGLVRSADGQKMSKTKGNVIDPLETIDKFGSDALRYSLVTGSTPGQDIPLSMERVEANRNFANKLWNAGKYLQNTLSTLNALEREDLAVIGPLTEKDIASYPLAERYIISRCHDLTARVTEALEAYNFGDAGRQIYEFLWDEYADWYIEVSKTRMSDVSTAKVARKTLVYVWDTCMKLLHPFMPFLTETLWQLTPHKGDSIMISSWPQLEHSAKLYVDANAVVDFQNIQSLVKAIRNARAEYSVEAGKKITGIIRVSEKMRSWLESERVAVSLLARLDDTLLQIKSYDDSTDISFNKDSAVHLIVMEGLEVFLPLSGMIDYKKEVERLSKQSEKINKDVEVLEKKLNSKGFLDKAPQSLVDETKASVADKKDQLVAIAKSITEYNNKLSVK